MKFKKKRGFSNTINRKSYSFSYGNIKQLKLHINMLISFIKFITVDFTVNDQILLHE